MSNVFYVVVKIVLVYSTHSIACVCEKGKCVRRHGGVIDNYYKSISPYVITETDFDLEQG